MKKKTIGILCGVLLFCLIGGLFIPVGEIRYEGNAYYSDEELSEALLSGGFGKSLLLLWARDRLLPHKEMSFLEKYKMRFSGRSVRVTVYEKALAGCIPFQDYYMYFDWDGVVVESSHRRLAEVPEISGLNLKYAVLGEKLPVEKESLISTMLVISQFLQNNGIRVDGTEKSLLELANGLDFSGGSITVKFGSLQVSLGEADKLEEKLGVMADILPSLAGRSGKLYLDNYRTSAVHPSYVFSDDKEQTLISR